MKYHKGLVKSESYRFNTLKELCDYVEQNNIPERYISAQNRLRYGEKMYRKFYKGVLGDRRVSSFKNKPGWQLVVYKPSLLGLDVVKYEPIQLPELHRYSLEELGYF